MSEVYEAVRDDIGLHVALKLLDAELAKNQGAQRRFLREARLLSCVDDPGLVKIVDFNADADTVPFLAMELLKGDSVRDRLERAPGGRLSILESVRLAEQVSCALSSMHRHGVIHRDLKPDNLMLVRDLAVRPTQERIKLMDFGIARAYDPVRKVAEQDSVIIGTPTYMSPEQFGGAPVGPYTDVYALGIVLYELLIGSPPFTGTLDEVRLMHQNELPPRLRQQLSGVPEPLDQLVRAMLEKRPERRPDLASIQRTLQDAESLLLSQSGDAVALSLNSVPELGAARLPGVVMEPRGALSSGRSFYGQSESLPASRAPSSLLKPLTLLAAGLSLAAVGLGVRNLREPQPVTRPSSYAGTASVPEGRFQMGSTSEEAEAAFKQCQQQLKECSRGQFEAEQPQRWIEISAFHVDQELVTAAEYVEFLNTISNKLTVRTEKNTPTVRYVDKGDAVLLDLYERGRIEYRDGAFHSKPGQGSLPVVQVSWNGARQYCQFYGKRLLYEAEWEYLRSLGPTHKLSPRLNLLPGLNEWVTDRYSAHYATCAKEVCKDPVLDDIPQDLEGYRVVRGCSQGEPHVFCRPQARGRKGANDPPLDSGFRCASSD